MYNKKIAVLVETEYIPKEIEFYKNYFTTKGMEVDFITNLWDATERVIVSDVTTPNEMPSTMTITKDISNCNVKDYSIVLVAANYVACRLREIPPMGSLGCIEELATPPAVQFMTQAMDNKKIVKGALCHALWLLTPVPQYLKNRKVICHTVVLADVHNAGAIYTPNDSHVVVDNDLVTARSASDLETYGKALLDTYYKLNN